MISDFNTEYGKYTENKTKSPSTSNVTNAYIPFVLID